MFVAAILIASLFIFPLWRITLIAPQYPDGVTMYIYINKIGGDSPSTLQNINILNHYVGMKYIEPDSIPELTYFPFIVLGIIGLAVIAGLVNKKWLILSWIIAVVVLSGLGVYDFYLWEYDYGHNLSPDAPIKVPGAVYQPPVFGTKSILNFKAQSYPSTGGILHALAIVLGFVAFWLKGKLSRS